jgi:hypothetical protein
MKSVLAILSLVFLASCASAGVQVTDEQLSLLRINQTTYPEAVALLGAPTSESRTGLIHVAAYSYATTSTHAATFVPVVGAFAGGADTHSRTIVLQFDQADVLRNISSSASNVTSHLY